MENPLKSSILSENTMHVFNGTACESFESLKENMCPYFNANKQLDLFQLFNDTFCIYLFISYFPFER